jgi:hypothetical protein
VQAAPGAGVLGQAEPGPVEIPGPAQDRRIREAAREPVWARVEREAPAHLAVRPTRHLGDSVSRRVNKARGQRLARVKRGQVHLALPARGNARDAPEIIGGVRLRAEAEIFKWKMGLIAANCIEARMAIAGTWLANRQRARFRHSPAKRPIWWTLVAYRTGGLPPLCKGPRTAGIAPVDKHAH